MRDADEDYRTMAITTRDGLQTDQPLWEPVYQKMKSAYTALDDALTGLDNLTGRAGGGLSRMKAEEEAIAAALPVIQGIRAVLLDDAPSDDETTLNTLTNLAKLNRTAIDELRDTAQVNKLQDLLKAATGISVQLAEERVTAGHLSTLDQKTVALKKLVAAPRKQVIADSQITAKEEAWLKKVKAAIKKLDVRVPNLKDELPEVVARYKKARKLIKLGGRSKKEKGGEGGERK